MESLAARDIHVTGGFSLKQLVPRILEGETEIDILHLHALPPVRYSPRDLARLWLNFRRLQVLRRIGIRIVLTVHDLAAHETASYSGDLYYGHVISRLADALIVHSESSRAILRRAWNLPDTSRIHVIPHPNFIDYYENRLGRDESRALFSFHDDEVVFLFLGLLRPYKGIDDLVAAFRSIRNRKVRLIIAGEPLTSGNGRRIAQSIRGDNRIRLFPGFVARDDVQIFMNASDAVVFPYRRVFTSGAALLAMSFGKACVATNVGPLCEVLGVNGGLFCAPHDPDSLKGALIKATCFNSALAGIGEHNLARAKEWSWNNMAGRTASLYHELMGGRTAQEANGVCRTEAASEV